MNEASIEIRDFRYFQAVAEELHFRRAAERLGIQQPQLSRHIRMLEARIGTPLLERTTRSVKLTAAGEDLLERARYVLTQVADAVASARLAASGHAGRLNIAFTPAAGVTLLPSVLSNFRREHPRVGINLSYRQTSKQVSDLIEGTLHFGFLRLPVQSPRLRTMTLAREGVVAALPYNHAAATRSPLHIKDLAGERFIQYTPALGVDFQEIIVSTCRSSGFSPDVVQKSSDTYAIVILVAAGYGIAILPEWVRKIPHQGVVFRDLPEIPRIIELAGCWLEEPASPAHEAFIESMNRYIERHPIDHDTL